MASDILLDIALPMSTLGSILLGKVNNSCGSARCLPGAMLSVRCSVWSVWIAFDCYWRNRKYMDLNRKVVFFLSHMEVVHSKSAKIIYDFIKYQLISAFLLFQSSLLTLCFPCSLRTNSSYYSSSITSMFWTTWKEKGKEDKVFFSSTSSPVHFCWHLMALLSLRRIGSLFSWTHCQSSKTQGVDSKEGKGQVLGVVAPLVFAALECIISFKC